MGGERDRPDAEPSGELARALASAPALGAARGAAPLVLALGSEPAELRRQLDLLRQGTRPRAIHISIPGSEPTGASVTAALVAALETRPGAARLLDPLVDGAASFVLGPELAAHAASLAPSALDASPAAAAAPLLARRFLPAFVAQVPDAPRELLLALIRARCHAPAEAPELAATADALAPDAFARAVGGLALRAGVPVVLAFEGGFEHPAATAAHALQLRAPAGFALLVPALADRWAKERALLSEAERLAAEERKVELSAASTAPAAPSAPAIAAPGPSSPTPTPTARAETTTIAQLSPGEASLPPRQRILARRSRAGDKSDEARIPSSSPARPGSTSVAALLETASATPGRTSGARPRIPGKSEIPGAPEGGPGAPRGPVRRLPRGRHLALAVLPAIFFGAIVLLGRSDPEVDRGPAGPARPTFLAPTAPHAPAQPLAPPRGPAPVRPPAPQPRPATARFGVAAPSPAAWVPPDPFANLHDEADVRRVLALEIDRAITVESRIAVVDGALAHLDAEGRTRAILAVLDAPPPPTSPRDTAMLRRALIERLAPVADLPAASARLIALLDENSPRSDRIAALRAVACGPQHFSQEMHDRLCTLAYGHEDATIEAQAQAIVQAQDSNAAPAR